MRSFSAEHFPSSLLGEKKKADPLPLNEPCHRFGGLRRAAETFVN
jgi:hypothetical protein